jgi:DNA repair protein RecN (Recombination protein N)
MISHISIEDFATIENMDVDLHKGLNIITGESGAGKSVFLTALSLALGSRADSSMIRTGADRALVQIIAEYQHKDIIISREISATGKNICKVDGEIVPLNKLAKICQQLADIHGQYDNQYLLNPENHIKLVDQYEKSSIIPAIRRVSELYDEYCEVDKRLKKLQDDAKDNERKKDYLNYQIDEIEKAQLTNGEDLKLTEEIDLLKNKEKIYKGLGMAYEIARGENSDVLSGLDNITAELKNISTISKEASDLEDEFSDLRYRLEDVIGKLRETRDRITFNSGDLDAMIERLDFIESMKRKYGDTINEILDLKEKLQHDLEHLNDIDSDIESVSLERSRVEEMLSDETDRLTSLRRASAATLQGKIQEQLEFLNFKDVEMSINVSSIDHFTPNGVDKVEFLISTNKGEPLKPLNKIASGGELSRIMLAFKMIIGEYDGIPTMIFDEIDSGISGETANIVGKTLSWLGNTHQVIAITHLPQIAACGDHNYRIEKSTDGSATYTTVTHLTDDEKVGEVARLLAGMNISDITIQNAKELIKISR